MQVLKSLVRRFQPQQKHVVSTGTPETRPVQLTEAQMKLVAGGLPYCPPSSATQSIDPLATTFN